LSQEANMSAPDRLVALLDHLGLDAAYFGTAIPRDISGLAAEQVAFMITFYSCLSLLRARQAPSHRRGRRDALENRTGRP
jgi:hypothetical protein